MNDNLTPEKMLPVSSMLKNKPSIINETDPIYKSLFCDTKSDSGAEQYFINNLNKKRSINSVNIN